MPAAPEPKYDGHDPRHDDAPGEPSTDAFVWSHAAAELPRATDQHRHADRKPGTTTASNWNANARPSSSSRVPGCASSSALPNPSASRPFFCPEKTSSASTSPRPAEPEHHPKARPSRRSQPLHDRPTGPISACQRRPTKRQKRVPIARKTAELTTKRQGNSKLIPAILILSNKEQ